MRDTVAPFSHFNSFPIFCFLFFCSRETKYHSNNVSFFRRLHDLWYKYIENICIALHSCARGDDKKSARDNLLCFDANVTSISSWKTFLLIETICFVLCALICFAKVPHKFVWNGDRKYGGRKMLISPSKTFDHHQQQQQQKCLFEGVRNGSSLGIIASMSECERMLKRVISYLNKWFII